MAAGDKISDVGKSGHRAPVLATLIHKVAAAGSAARRIVRALVAPGMAEDEEPRPTPRGNRRASPPSIPRLEVWGERRDRPNRTL
jgi:hypothetical protein